MNKLVTAAALLLLLLAGAPVKADAAAPSLNWGSEVNPSRCPTDQGYRYLEINVTRKVEGDSTTWAELEYNEHIQVWRIGTSDGGGGAERFCALVRFQGSFTTLDGPSPAGTETIAAGIDGSFEGGYRLVFNADELASPLAGTRGHLGTITEPVGLLNFGWRSLYFMNVGSDNLQWWGWVYHGGNNGAWVNSFDGDQGDITN